MGLQGRSGEVRKITLSAGFFFFVLYSYFFVVIVLAFCLCPYSTTHTTQTFMPPAGFKPATPAVELPQTPVSDRSATGIGIRSPNRPSRSESLYRPGFQTSTADKIQ